MKNKRWVFCICSHLAETEHKGIMGSPGRECLKCVCAQAVAVFDEKLFKQLPLRV